MHCCFLFVTRNKESWHRGYSGINIDDTTRQPTRDTAMNAVLAPASRLAASQPQPGSLCAAFAWPSWLQGVVLSSLPPMCCLLARCCCIPIEPILLLLVCLRILQFISMVLFPIEFSIQFRNGRQLLKTERLFYILK